MKKGCGLIINNPDTIPQIPAPKNNTIRTFSFFGAIYFILVD
jgi:hypothetical protein